MSKVTTTHLRLSSAEGQHSPPLTKIIQQMLMNNTVNLRFSNVKGQYNLPTFLSSPGVFQASKLTIGDGGMRGAFELNYFYVKNEHHQNFQKTSATYS